MFTLDMGFPVRVDVHVQRHRVAADGAVLDVVLVSAPGNIYWDHDLFAARVADVGGLKVGDRSSAAAFGSLLGHGTQKCSPSPSAGWPKTAGKSCRTVSRSTASDERTQAPTPLLVRRQNVRLGLGIAADMGRLVGPDCVLDRATRCRRVLSARPKHARLSWERVWPLWRVGRDLLVERRASKVAMGRG